MIKYALLGGAAWVLYPIADNKIKFYHAETPKNKQLIESIPTLAKGSFFPTIWIPGGFLQALLGSGRTRMKNDLKFTESVLYQRELITLEDGGTYSVDWVMGNEMPDNNKILLIVPGLTGGSEAPYIKNPVKIAQDKGYRVGVVHGRGICGTPLTTLKPNLLGDSKDLGFAIQHIHKKYPDAPIVALGTSMGGNLVLKYAGESGNDCLLKGISVISTPFDIAICARYLKKNWPKSRIADMYLTKSILNMITRHEDFYEAWEKDFGVSMDTAIKVERSFDFDLHFTCKVLGHNDPEDYYEYSSCVSYLNKIKVPVFALSSMNDPVVTNKCIPYDEFKSNPNLILAVTRTGGHIGWFTGQFKAERWYAHPTLEFLDKAIENPLNKLSISLQNN
ncbi:unnamed protein product [Blepharisma stoltei]|uniref:AB hydrolase-1 domain-containing protein n=1 Tax=Blepharisma stoltei TaxID=1481888 RepID=A0AAU9JM36_9CILI|nr:unnamed protein product [Blepharisma stoltei]